MSTGSSQRVRSHLPMIWVVRIACWVLYIAAVALFISWLNTPSSAHEAPMGWSYDPSCCGGHDCRQLADGDVSEQADGYYIASKGWTVRYGSGLIKPSLDEHYHLCEGTMYTTSPTTPGGAKPEAFPRCFYAPSPAF